MKKSKLYTLMTKCWADQLYPYFQTESFKLLTFQIATSKKSSIVSPLKDDIFKIFKETKIEDIKVVLWGKEPYSTTLYDDNPIATGRAYAANLSGEVNLPDSLKNILRELESDLSCSTLGFDTSLDHLVKQGVFLLNTALTVSKNNSHISQWKDFTIAVCKVLNNQDNIVHIMPGKHVQLFKNDFTNPTHKFIEVANPSSFSANNGFKNSKPFSKCNGLLKTPIEWLDLTYLDDMPLTPRECFEIPKKLKITKDQMKPENRWVLPEDIKILPYEGQEE